MINLLQRCGFFILVTIPGFAAGPMTHIWVAERFCEIAKIEDPSVIQKIIVGTSYPDIRYVTHLSRDLTHPEIRDIQDVYHSETPFEAGMKLHVWVDIVREAYVKEEVYEEVSLYAKGHLATFLKLLEEEILADFYDGRQWHFSFSGIFPEEYAYADEASILTWHSYLQWNMHFRPSWLLWAQSYRKPLLGLSVDTLYDWSYLFPKLKNKPIFLNHMQGLMEHLLMELKRLPITELRFLNS